MDLVANLLGWCLLCGVASLAPLHVVPVDRRYKAVQRSDYHAEPFVYLLSLRQPQQQKRVGCQLVPQWFEVP